MTFFYFLFSIPFIYLIILWGGILPPDAQIGRKLGFKFNIFNIGYATTLFYEKHGNITYIASGLGDSSKDLLLKVNVPANKQANFELIPMAMSQTNPLELADYDRAQLNDYATSKRSGFKQFLFKLPFIKFVISLPPKQFFYLGMLTSGLLFFLIFLIFLITKRISQYNKSKEFSKTL
jgi:hypothetical protein